MARRPVRFHVWSRGIAKYHAIRIEESEQFTADRDGPPP